MSLKLVPASLQASEEAHVVSSKATAHPIHGTHDTFRYGLKSAAQDVTTSTSPLQARLEKWEQNQQQLQATMQRNTFGLSVPMRKAMELKIVSESLHNPLIANPPLSLGGSHNIAHEILSGTDESLDAVDFMSGGKMNEVLDVSSVMERSRGI